MNFFQTNQTADSSLGDLLTDCSIDRVMAIDNSWHIIAWNKTLEIISGLSRVDVMGRHLTDVLPAIAEDPELMSAIMNAQAGLKTFVPAAKNRFNRHHAENHFIPLKDANGNSIGVMNIIHDVAHRIKVENRLAELNAELEKKYKQLEEANASLSTFTGLVSREIQEPVKNIYSALEFIAVKEGKSLSQGSRGSMRKMQASLNRIQLLLGDLLHISRISLEQDKTPNLSLNQVVSETLNEIQTKLTAKEVRVTVGQLPAISGYKDMLKYLFHELIENAIRFQPQNQAPAIVISCKEEIIGTERFYRIDVKDNGIGFDPSHNKEVFEMFKRLDAEHFRGSGIGLALCSKIMDLHQGSIVANGDPGNGTTISCLFPAGENNTV